jgi:hypothetical protein
VGAASSDVSDNLGELTGSEYDAISREQPSMEMPILFVDARADPAWVKYGFVGRQGYVHIACF